jgi:ribokinase
MRITVVGSINVDLVAKTNSMVSPGETVLAEETYYFPGGKGANQALACARLGGDTGFIGKLGDDHNAEIALTLLSKSSCKMQTSRIVDTATGLAIILLDANGENSIVVSPGANYSWSETDEEITRILDGTQILVLQLEIPIDTVKRFLKIAREKGIRTVLNPSPVTPEIRDALPLVDLLLVNKTEAEYFTGMEADNSVEYRDCIRSLGVAAAVVTLGSEGALVFEQNKVSSVSARQANVVDTTAAGDTYTGALVSRLSKGYDLPAAAEFASYASAIAVSRMGAQPSIPTQNEVDSLIDAIR